MNTETLSSSMGKRKASMHASNDHARRLRKDFHTPTSDNSQDTTKVFRFFNLPRELRDEIYDCTWRHFAFRFTLKDGTREINVVIDTQYDTSDSEDVYRLQRFPPWLYANTQLRQEALEQFYRRANFTVDFTTGLPQERWIVRKTWPYSEDMELSRRDVPLLRKARYVTFAYVPVQYPWQVEFSLPHRTLQRFKRYYIDRLPSAIALLHHLRRTAPALRTLDIRMQDFGRFELFFSSRDAAAYRNFNEGLWNGIGDALPRSLKRCEISIVDDVDTAYKAWIIAVHELDPLVYSRVRDAVFAKLVDAIRLAVTGDAEREPALHERSDVRTDEKFGDFQMRVWKCEATCAGYKSTAYPCN